MTAPFRTNKNIVAALLDQKDLDPALGMAGGGFAREGEPALDAGVAGRGGVVGVVDGEAQGDELVAFLRKYLFAGGMPEAVAQFAENGDYAAVRAIQEDVAAGFEPHYWSSDSGNAEVEFAIQGAGAVFPVEAKAGVNTKAKSLQVYRKLFRPPFAIRTSLRPHRDGTETKDIPLYALGAQLGALLSESPA